MTEQVQAAEQSIQLGFGQALVMMYGPDWRENLSEETINVARHFYHRGLSDLQIVVHVGQQRHAADMQAVFSTLALGAEKELEEQAAAQAQASQEAGEKTKEAIAMLNAAPSKKPAKKDAKGKAKGSE